MGAHMSFMVGIVMVKAVPFKEREVHLFLKDL